MPSSISVYLYLLDSMRDGYKEIYSFEYSNLLFWCIYLYRYLLILGSFIVITFNRRGYEPKVLTTIAVCMITNVSMSVGGYSIILYLSLVPVLMELRFSRCYLLIVASMFLPLGLIGLVDYDVGFQDVYLSGSNTFINWAVSVGAIVNPFLNSALLICLLYEVGFIAQGKKTIPSIA